MGLIITWGGLRKDLCSLLPSYGIQISENGTENSVWLKVLKAHFKI